MDFTKRNIQTSQLQLQRNDPISSSIQYFEDKHDKNAVMARYTSFLASLHAEKKDYEKAEEFHRKTLEINPSDPMAHNDYSLHLLHKNMNKMKEEMDSSDKKKKKIIKKYHLNPEDPEYHHFITKKNKDVSLSELKKAELTSVTESSIIKNNMAAVLSLSSNFTEALQYAHRADQLAENDPVINRNLAKIYKELGNTTESLKHNLKAIEIEKNKHELYLMNPSVQTAAKPNTSAYRTAAVQIISQGGEYSEALDLIRRARQLEKKEATSSTTERTNEIINKIKTKQEIFFSEIEKKKLERLRQKEEEKRQWINLIQK